MLIKGEILGITIPSIASQLANLSATGRRQTTEDYPTRKARCTLRDRKVITTYLRFHRKIIYNPSLIFT